MRVLIVGSGGREDAIAWKLRQSPRCEQLYVAPGNGGTMRLGQPVPIAAKDIDGIVAFAKKEHIDLVVVGPEAPLADGLVDDLSKAGIRSFGPSSYGAELEASKIFTKTRCVRWNIPTAYFDFAGTYEVAKLSIKKNGFRVIKADGLCGGKGAIVTKTTRQALAAAHDFLVKKSEGPAGSRIVMEEKLSGPEWSVMAIIRAGINIAVLPVVRDYKRINDNNQGLNTGGMGAFSPVSDVSDAMLVRIKEEILLPTVNGMAKRGTPFDGVLYAGIMLTKKGPKLIEYNVRFGDPECQVLMRRLESDAFSLFETPSQALWSKEAVVCVVLTSRGYPGKPEIGYPIEGIYEAEQVPGVVVFHAGTKQEGSTYYTSGGRILNVTASGATLAEARERAYVAVQCIKFEGMHYRSDIAA